MIVGEDHPVIAFLKNGSIGSGAAAHAERTALDPSPLLPHSGIRAFRISLEGNCDWTVFGIWLSLLVHAHGGRVLRVKGLLDIVGASAPVAINCVQSLVYFPEHLRDWPDADRQSMLVFIVHDLEPECVLKSLRVFLGANRATLLPSGTERAQPDRLTEAL